MNKRSILTAVLALGLGVTALTGCSDNTGANYVTPSNVETIQNTIAEIGDQGVKVPEKRDLKVTLPVRTRTPSPSPLLTRTVSPPTSR